MPRRDWSPLPPNEELAYFGVPPLLKGEDPSQYNQLLIGVSSSVVPLDIFERAFVRTIVNLIWETNRYRRMIANTLTAAEQQALERVLKVLLDGTETANVFDGFLKTKSQELAQQYVLQQQPAVQEVDALLASAGLNFETVKATAFSLRQREIESLNRMVASAEARMKTTLREVDRHRKGFGLQVHHVIEEFMAPTEEPEEFKRAA